MIKNLKNKKVTVMGLGLHGGGVAVVNWLISHGAKVTVTDLKTEKELRISLDEIKARRRGDSRIAPSADVKYVLGKHREADFKHADFIVQNPGVPRESRYLEIARTAGILIENEASLFFKNCPAKIIGVTGTRGKSTTASLIYETLKCPPAMTAGQARRAGVQGDKRRGKVWLAGLPHKPMLEILDKVKPNDLVVLELSSWQLEILGRQKLSPHVAVITNIYPDHLNRYKGMADYMSAKKNIFAWQKQSDFAVFNLDNSETREFGREAVAQRFWFSKKYFSGQNGSFLKGDYFYFRKNGQVNKSISRKAAKLKGEHNLENILAAITVAEIFTVKPKAIKSALKNFKSLPGRFEFIREIKGVKYINDTTATTPDGTIAALKALAGKNMVLIAGGDTKKIPDAKYEELAGMIEKKCKAVVLFSGQGSTQLLDKLKRMKLKKLVSGVDKMSQAICLARSFAKAGDIILLSPACASFNLFINEFDRGEQFNKIVAGLSK